MLLTIGVIVAITLSGQEWLWTYAVKEVAKDQTDELNRDAFLFESQLRGRANDMYFLKHVAEAELARDPLAPVAGDNLRSAILTMMLARSQYDQIRVLDMTGHEILRYNWNSAPGASPPVTEVPQEQLQTNPIAPTFARPSRRCPARRSSRPWT